MMCTHTTSFCRFLPACVTCNCYCILRGRHVVMWVFLLFFSNAFASCTNIVIIGNMAAHFHLKLQQNSEVENTNPLPLLFYV
ncbi:hypothetical protein VIGAN_11002200 [Vigna angularis var. angularis]|uniref:Uncharacterized protein n=1 Tax=Vigna angularis var. angularis TaxID=157739 RepID=A0A0S3T700_PHAAN|nr:hypothetical protein VIGAN_11002200 [Vigna angularis var. angularis]